MNSCTPIANSTHLLERKILSSLHIEIADYYSSTSAPRDPRKATGHYLEGLKILHAIIAVDPADIGVRREAAMTEKEIGIAHHNAGREGRGGGSVRALSPRHGTRLESRSRQLGSTKATRSGSPFPRRASKSR